MKRLRITLLSIAILTALTGAYATRECQACAYYQQYRLHNNSYIPAGDDGIDYICFDMGGICTWYKPTPSSNYTPCKYGYFFSLH